MAGLAAEGAVAIGLTVGPVVASAAVYAASLLVIRSKMQPKSQYVGVQDLRPGDQISYKLKQTIYRRYAIVIKIIQGSTVSLMYMTGKEGSGRINYENIDLSPYSNDLTRLEYNPVVCFGKDRVATRTKSLSVETDHNPSERHSAIRDYWKFFKDDEHFSIWCQTGISFTSVLQGILTSDYTYSEVKRLSSLRNGDHVCYKVGILTHKHGIVVDLDSKDTSITVVTFLNRDASSVPTEEKYGVDELMRKGQLYRYDYDIAVGSHEDTVVQRARNEVGIVRDQKIYNGSREFAIWCKTLTDNNLSDLSTLAKARVAGHVYTKVETVTMVQPGEHIAFNAGTIYYYQHAIVVRTVDNNQLEIVYLPGNVFTVENFSIKRVSLENIGEYIRKGQLFKYFYDLKEWEDRSEVIRRAESKVDQVIGSLPFKDPYHFAVWCRTGHYQVHLPNVDT